MSQVQQSLPDTYQLYMEIYKVTEALAALSAGELIEEQDTDALHSLLVKRQELIARAAGSTVTGSINAAEMRSLIQKIMDLDVTVRHNLQQKRDAAKNHLQKIQTGKQAGRAYSAPQQQREGFFIDTRKN
jgi:predicted methyltransferase MtxX (methanogen marker protein 4)